MIQIIKVEKQVPGLLFLSLLYFGGKEMKIKVEADVDVRKDDIFEEMKEFSYRIASVLEKMLRERGFVERIWDMKVEFSTPEYLYWISPMQVGMKLEEHCDEKKDEINRKNQSKKEI
jgi:hypothetical protein